MLEAGGWVEGTEDTGETWPGCRLLWRLPGLPGVFPRPVVLALIGGVTGQGLGISSLACGVHFTFGCEVELSVKEKQTYCILTNPNTTSVFFTLTQPELQ